MEKAIISTFKPDEDKIPPSVTEATVGVTSVIGFLNDCQMTIRKSDFNSADGFLKVQMNNTLTIGRQFWDVTKKSTEIDLSMAEYAGKVSSNIRRLREKGSTGQKFSVSMKHLLKKARNIHRDTKEIQTGYDDISNKLQQIHGECQVKTQDLGQEKEVLDRRAMIKAKKGDRNEKIALAASVVGSVSAVFFPPAAAFFGGIVAIEAWNAKRHGKKAQMARDESCNIQGSLQAIETFQGVITSIRDIVGGLERFWNDQVSSVQNLVETAEEKEDYVELDDDDAVEMEDQWKGLEDQFKAYNVSITGALRQYVMIGS